MKSSKNNLQSNLSAGCMVSHVIQKHLAGTQKTHWVKTSKAVTLVKMVIYIVCLISVRFSRSGG